MPLLYYWGRDNYQRDLDLGAGYYLNQDNPVMHEAERRDSLYCRTLLVRTTVEVLVDGPG